MESRRRRSRWRHDFLRLRIFEATRQYVDTLMAARNVMPLICTRILNYLILSTPRTVIPYAHFTNHFLAARNVVPSAFKNIQYQPER